MWVIGCAGHEHWGAGEQARGTCADGGDSMAAASAKDAQIRTLERE